MTPEAISAAVAQGLKDGMENFHNPRGDMDEAQRKAFYVKPETHSKHHVFVGSQIQFFDWVRETAIKTLVKLFVGGMVAALGLGIAVFFYLKSQGIIERLLGGG